MNLAEGLARLDGGAVLFELPQRALLEISGSERVRWLDGMVTNDVKALEAAGPCAGAAALALTNQGRIVAALQVIVLPDVIWLELDRAALAALVAHFESRIIADDVALADRSADFSRLSVEGRDAAAIVDRAVGSGLGLEPAEHAQATLAGIELRVAAYGVGARAGCQLFVPPARGDGVRAALVEAGAPVGSAELLEVYRIEQGTPWQGRELDESVLPAEARLDHAVSATKGCYIGQEVVARLRSRDRRNHLLVGLRFGADEPPAPGAVLEQAGRSRGEATSTIVSPRYGAIGLGFVHHACAEPGTALRCAGISTRVVELPFRR